MSEKKGLPAIAVTPNKIAMSRALGAAFLNHQVEKLEKTVSVTNGGHGIHGHGYGHGMATPPSIGNWRSRKFATPQSAQSSAPNGGNKQPPMAPGIKVASKGSNAKEDSQAARKARAAAAGVAGANTISSVGRNATPKTGGAIVGQRSADRERDDKETDADIIVVDASVLVHALYQIKKWCRDGREEVIIVPLEALNTLDLLKKGTSALAQRARAASRILEAQVGTNPRIRVQQDDAFVFWGNISFDAAAPDVSPSSAERHSSPEWVRRVICCAKWEVDNAAKTLAPKGPSPPGLEQAQAKAQQVPRVVLAVLSAGVTEISPRMHALKLSESPTESQSLLLNPVPLPGPTHSHSTCGANKFEPRSSGVLVKHWAAQAGIQVLEVEPTRHGIGGTVGHSEDEGGGPRSNKRVLGRGRRGSNTEIGGGNSGSPDGSGLVERPPAVRAMMEMVAQQTSTARVVRVLARGEKLDLDP